ncbi:MAG TPA: hypothetical protein VGJ51_12725, partial [Candidatus Angelobacter sp.]
ARDFACGLRPQNGSTRDPSASLGISPADYARKTAQLEIPRLCSGFRLRATPAKRLNLTKLFAIFLHKKDVFLR